MEFLVSFHETISIYHNSDLILLTECNLTTENHRTECPNVVLFDAGKTKFKDSNQAN